MFVFTPKTTTAVTFYPPGPTRRARPRPAPRCPWPWRCRWPTARPRRSPRRRSGPGDICLASSGPQGVGEVKTVGGSFKNTGDPMFDNLEYGMIYLRPKNQDGDLWLFFKKKSANMWLELLKIGGGQKTRRESELLMRTMRHGGMKLRSFLARTWFQ